MVASTVYAQTLFDNGGTRESNGLSHTFVSTGIERVLLLNRLAMRLFVTRI